MGLSIPRNFSRIGDFRSIRHVTSYSFSEDSGFFMNLFGRWDSILLVDVPNDDCFNVQPRNLEKSKVSIELKLFYN